MPSIPLFDGAQDTSQLFRHLNELIVQINNIPGVTMEGVTDGSDAAPGQIGEFFYRAITTAVPVTNNVPVDLDSGTIPPGDWDIVGEAYFQASTSAGTDDLRVWVNTVSATQPTGDMGGLAIASTTSGGQINNLTCSPWRLSIAVPTLIYLSVNANFGAGTMQVKGFVRGRRMR
jgi:hypothetical protein